MVGAATTVSCDSTDFTFAADLREYEPYFTAIHLMCYDLWNGPNTAGSNSALPASAGIAGTVDLEGADMNTPGDEPFANGNKDQSTGQGGVDAWFGAGIPINKLVYGVPFYGYGYDLDSPNGPATQGLYAAASGKSPGDTYENQSETSGFWRWRSLKSQGVVVQQGDGSYAPGPGWQGGFNEPTLTPYVWSPSRSEIISFDDPASLLTKRNFAEQNGMAGMMFWAMYGDTDDAELTRVLT